MVSSSSAGSLIELRRVGRRGTSAERTRGSPGCQGGADNAGT